MTRETTLYGPICLKFCMNINFNLKKDLQWVFKWLRTLAKIGVDHIHKNLALGTFYQIILTFFRRLLLSTNTLALAISSKSAHFHCMLCLANSYALYHSKSQHNSILPNVAVGTFDQITVARATISIGSTLCVLGFIVPYTATSFWTVFLFYGIVAGTYMTRMAGS